MQHELIPHLFRQEYSKIVAVLCRRFGFDQIEIAEDIAADTFLVAAQTWGLSGLPANPIAWLYSVAKNKAKNQLQRQTVLDTKVTPELQDGTPLTYQAEIDLSEANIKDSQLQMMFAICHPAIAPEAQIGLSLRILCGFGIDEIADAFLTNKDTINKRLYRAKQKLRTGRINIAFPDSNEIDQRLENVLTTIYLLFNEGYYSVSKKQTINKELCFEAIRLCHILVEHERTNRPEVNALLALMYFHSSRFDARIDKNGELILYGEQDVELWDYELIRKGVMFLNRSATGERLSKYHLQGTIAYWNTQKTDTAEKWENILDLYNRLLQIDYSPIAALNRTYALSKVQGKPTAIVEAEKLKLQSNHFYYALLGDLYTGVDNVIAAEHFQNALTLAITHTDKNTMRRKLKGVDN